MGTIPFTNYNPYVDLTDFMNKNTYEEPDERPPIFVRMERHATTRNEPNPTYSGNPSYPHAPLDTRPDPSSTQPHEDGEIPNEGTLPAPSLPSTVATSTTDNNDPWGFGNIMQLLPMILMLKLLMGGLGGGGLFGGSKDGDS